MKAAKRILLIGGTIVALLSLTGCMVISCEDCRPHRPRHLKRPPHCKVIDPVHVVRF